MSDRIAMGGTRVGHASRFLPRIVQLHDCNFHRDFLGCLCSNKPCSKSEQCIAMLNGTMLFLFAFLIFEGSKRNTLLHSWGVLGNAFFGDSHGTRQALDIGPKKTVKNHGMLDVYWGTPAINGIIHGYPPEV